MQQTTEQKGLLDLLAKVLTFAKSEKARLLPYELQIVEGKGVPLQNSLDDFPLISLQHGDGHKSMGYAITVHLDSLVGEFGYEPTIMHDLIASTRPHWLILDELETIADELANYYALNYDSLHSYVTLDRLEGSNGITSLLFMWVSSFEVRD